MGPPIDKKQITITDDMITSWQGVVDTVAEMAGVPSALIMKVAPPFIEVFRSSASQNNPYEVGDRERLPGLYCEWVIKHRSRLLVANALKDKEWATNPDTRLGMIAYLGFPLLWPDGEVFGTICVLDAKENRFGPSHERLLLKFKELVEAHLALLYKATFDRKNLEGILDNLTEGIIAHDTERHILFFNKAAEEITGYSREDVLGKDCHEAFGGPFCGGRCAFIGEAPQSLAHLDYPLNIVTRKGEPRRIEMSVTGMTDETGSFVGILAAFRDVTDVIGSQIKLGELTSFAGIVGHDYRMQRIFQQIRELATNDYPVHISGETGTGKELVAAAIHNESRRGGGPFVPVNCAALPEGTLESELFGHVKGAFTGALRDKKGRFELAHKGTLFLDEVADLPQFVQVKLLRVLQEGAFERVGAENTTSVNVRIVSATNRDLKQEVDKGRFREDLYYRINVVPIHMPPLRKRRKDIPLLIEHLLGRALEEGLKSPGFSKRALSVMMDYPWPGNVRELQSAIRFALVKSRGRTIQPDHLPLELRKWQEGRPPRGPSRKLDVERVQAALARSGGNKAKAARMLGVGRATLYRFLADFPGVS
ncbi:MAG: sigma 54-interacting transcriptional regulator [Thermodesulfobacteriota bacterium]|nr:sigma 54-interacting transcriptional regulator [Thermodesulfobacteriota bacterium]